MKASMINPSNDVCEPSVIAAGGLVYLTASKVPDLIIGTSFLSLSRQAHTGFFSYRNDAPFVSLCNS
jgi:hypothetical protein